MAEKGVQVSATVPKEWADALDEHQWTARMKKTGIVRLAVQQYMEREGLLPVVRDRKPSMTLQEAEGHPNYPHAVSIVHDVAGVDEVEELPTAE